MTTTHLLISLGTTICIGIFLYFYLKKRTEKIEKKVNLMFQLIQEHEKQARQQARMIISEKPSPPSSNNTPTQSPSLQTQNTSVNNNLIAVSDDDYEADSDDSDDSDEVSDNEQETLVISNLQPSLALNGAEITSKVFTFESNKETDKSHEDEDEENSVVNSDDSDDDNKSDSDASTTVQIVEVQPLSPENNLDEITLDDFNEVASTIDKSDTSNEKIELNYAEMKEEVDSLVQNITLQKLQSDNKTIKQIAVAEVGDLSKLRVPELKAKCSELGLEGYKSLRKGALIELIETTLK